MSFKKFINEKTSGKTWYMKGVNMLKSFKGLELLAEELGVSFESGDILIVDSNRGDKRKVFRITPHGYIILYTMLLGKNTFVIHKKKPGKIKDQINMAEGFMY